MAVTINADNGVSSGSAGLKQTADSTGVLALQTNGTTAVTVDASQNVGIGTSSPAAKLNVSGNAIISTTDNTNAALRITQLGTGNALLVEDSTNPDSTPFVIDASGKTIVGYTTVLSSRISSTSITPAVQVVATSFSNASIGQFGYNATPYHVFSRSASPTLGSNSVVSSGDSLGIIEFTGDDGTNFTSAARIQAAVDGTPGTSDMPGRLVFSTTADGASSPTERMRIDSSGNLLVGTTSTIGSATGVLQVKGAASQNAMQVQIGTNGNNGILWYNASASAIGSIVVNSGSVAYNTTSDYRLKENIAPMTGALDKVSALRPCTYTWKATGEHTQGFIAHELAEVVPDAVSGQKDAVDADGNPVYQGIDTSFLVATLTAAIQEQQALITALTARIEALEAK